MLTVGSLFSGIGGLELGLERTGGFKTIWNCEIDEYASAVLKKHWSVPNLGDITKVDWNGIERPDVICGGFPCQDISVAGKGAGIEEGKRSGLWREFSKAICVLRPRYAVIENVPMLVKRGLSTVLCDLASAGYDAEWRVISASSVGAPHKRERIFIVAHPNVRGCRASGDNRGSGLVLPASLRKLQEANEERDGRQFGAGSHIETAPDANGNWELQSEGSFKNEWERINSHPAGIGGKERHGNDGESCGEGRAWNWRGSEDLRALTRNPFERSDKWPQPLLRRVDDGVPSRVDRIKCLGNAVVPQVAQEVGKIILEMEKVVADG